jgi:hypothetical protein
MSGRFAATSTEVGPMAAIAASDLTTAGAATILDG